METRLVWKLVFGYFVVFFVEIKVFFWRFFRILGFGEGFLVWGIGFYGV